MAVTYDKIAYPLIENAVKNLINNEFQNVYVSPKFEMKGNECIRINLLDSNAVETHTNYEERQYGVSVRYYFNCDMHKPANNEAVKGKIDRLKKHLLDNQVKEEAGAKWVQLGIDAIEYNVQDGDNDDMPEVYIAELNLEIINHNPF
tara:strand:- start:419 stop:859 length:441 start_codon:yes stop_codon:yes gene_type:complete